MIRRLLFTPGPLTTSTRVKRAMLQDWGSRDPGFTAITTELLDGLALILAPQDDQVIVPIQGSGTFAVEAMVGSVVPPDGKLLIVQNGAYAKRIHEIALALGRRCSVLACPELTPVSPAIVTTALMQDPDITHVAVVHLETVSGVRNPLKEIANAVSDQGRRLIVDAISSFAVIDLSDIVPHCEAIAFSSNKGLQGPPGLGFVLARTAALVPGHSASLALDLERQFSYLRDHAQWRFTPPTHVLAATNEAVRELFDEGGLAARRARYADNFAVLLAGCADLGLVPALAGEFLGPPILAIEAPRNPAFRFADLYDYLRDRDLYIYPGGLAGPVTFRIGCIGDLDRQDMSRLIAAMKGYWDRPT